MKANSLISGKSQPIQKLKIKGVVYSGVCSTKFQVYFENKREEPIEISFAFPLPYGVCANRYKIKYNDQEVESLISNTEDAQIEYDDAIASSDFAAFVQNTQRNELRINIGTLLSNQKCKLTLFYDIAFTPFVNGYFLILPTTIGDISKTSVLGLNPPPIQLKLQIHDDKPISSIATPFTETQIDISKGLITSENLSLFHPVHVVVKYQNDCVGLTDCLFQKADDKIFMRCSATSPANERMNSALYTVLLEKSDVITSNEFSVVLRALQFFILSVPIGSKFNIAFYGSSDSALFAVPSLLDTDNRKASLDFVTNPPHDGKPATFVDVYKRLVVDDLKNALSESDESDVVIIGSALDDSVELDERHNHFMIDPFARGDIASCARAKKAVFVPVFDTESIIEQLLSIIKMTGCGVYSDVSLQVGETKLDLSPVLPGCTFSFTCCFDQFDFSEARLNFDEFFIPLKPVESHLPVINKIWAAENVDYMDASDPLKSLAESILQPHLPSAAVIECEDEVEGDIIHVETQITSTGLQWVERHLFDKDENQPQHPIPPIIPHPIPPIIPHPIIPLPIHPVPFHHGSQNLFIPAKGYKKRETPKTNESDNFAHIDVIERIRQRNEERRSHQPQTVPKKSFFLLRLLQVQSADGSWSDEKSMRVCCGFNIPPENEMDPVLPRQQFLTVFALACLRTKAQNDERKWELIEQNALTYLKSQDGTKNWEEIILYVQSKLN